MGRFSQTDGVVVVDVGAAYEAAPVPVVGLALPLVPVLSPDVEVVPVVPSVAVLVAP